MRTSSIALRSYDQAANLYIGLELHRSREVERLVQKRLKCSNPIHVQEMLDAVTAAIERHRQRRTVEGDLSRMQQRFGTLSPRELQVMLLITAGKMNKQVAGGLGISEITAKIHRGAAMRKMGARTLADLVRMADVLKPKGS
jgi:FixJ family two-component response regulator